MALQPVIRKILFAPKPSSYFFSRNPPSRIHEELESILSRPSWSVKSLLPAEGQEGQAPSTVTQSELHHLLKLSALPLPKNQDEETRMLKTLESQIHFVKEVQKIDTTGVEPLVAIRDETAQNITEEMITLEKLQPFLDQEQKVGINGTIRRRKPTQMIKDSGWNPFELGEGKDSRKKGNFFFIRKANQERTP